MRDAMAEKCRKVIVTACKPVFRISRSATGI
jgi:hypothetical protein